MSAQVLEPAQNRHHAATLLASLRERSRPWQQAVERLRALAQLPGVKPGGYAVHETIAAARPALLASLQQCLGTTVFAVVPTPDAAERAFADLLYYLGERSDAVALLRSRDEALGAIESPSERSARVTLLEDLSDGAARIVLAPVAAARQHLMPREEFQRGRFVLRAGDEPGWERLQQRLYDLGYARCDVVSAVGEYAVRGGIIDLFAATAETPARIEFFGDQIESMRAFAIESQRSSTPLETLTVAPWTQAQGAATIFDYLPADATIVLEEPATLAAIAAALDEERARERHTLLGQELEDDETLLAEPAVPPVSLGELGQRIARHATLIFPSAIEGTAPLDWAPTVLESFVLECRPAQHFNRQLGLFSEAMRQWSESGETVEIVSAAASRTIDLLRAAGISTGARTRGGVFVEQGSIESGFSIPSLRLHVLGDREIFGAPPKRVKIRAVKEGVPVTLADLRVGDYVVHAVHGIGQYLGLRAETILGATQDYLDLRYAGSDRMLVPVTQMHQIAKYSAAEGQAPRLSKMGGADWARTRSRVSAALEEIADRLVALYAERESSRGYAFGPDTTWQAEMEEAFPYEPTPDQRKAIEATKNDMESARPMDRLICGDVGYGKTEIAVRAAFKAVQDGKQVAVLVPTTLLVQQHFSTFAERYAQFPVNIRALSRFQTDKEAAEVLRGLADGTVDVVIGTHRLFSKDAKFKDLGLVIVDEEQRFGVEHKEYLKQMRANVDVLTMSATPIPRTLEMAVTGIREMSTIQTPPEERHPVLTFVGAFEEKQIAAAIRRELLREGQVFYIHNRVESINRAANRLQELVPEAQVAVAHGQMNEHTLERLIVDFWNREFDVLVCTTIVESGIDIANANTLIVERADVFGLAQLHQLRGRVGRGRERAYSYFLYPPEKPLTETAHERLATIAQHTDLGAGMYVAMKDLEIRGAGNLLGGEQSGHIEGVGFDLYVRMVGEAVNEFRAQAEGRTEPEPADVRVDLPIDAHIPHDWVPDERLRLEAYKRIASITDPSGVTEVHDELVDRYGQLPPPVGNLLAVALFRAHARTAGLTEIATQGNYVKFAPVELRESQAMRLQRVYPKSLVKAPTQTILVPKPMTQRLGGQPVTGLELLGWCRALIDAVLLM